MTLEIGQSLPDAKVFEMTADGPTAVQMADITSGRMIALIGVPGAFTPTCHNTHLPSFISSVQAFKDKGVDEVICISVNDPFVMSKWGEVSGASDAGIRMIGDADAAFAKAAGLDFDASGAGLGIRAKRFSAIVDNGSVKALNIEGAPGQAVETLGEVLLGQI